jgi:hypothetical protein
MEETIQIIIEIEPLRFLYILISQDIERVARTPVGIPTDRCKSTSLNQVFWFVILSTEFVLHTEMVFCGSEVK